MICHRCKDSTHIEFKDRTERCNGCDRTPAWCRCAPVTAQREPNWLSAARERRNGLARDLTVAA